MLPVGIHDRQRPTDRLHIGHHLDKRAGHEMFGHDEARHLYKAKAIQAQATNASVSLIIMLLRKAN